MTVRVLLFAAAREAAGDSVEVTLPQPALLADLRDALSEQHPALAQVLPHARLAIDSAYAREEDPITPDSEIALIPPVSGG